MSATHPTFDNATFTLAVPDTTLVLRPVRLSDAPNLRARCADPLNVRFLPHLQGKEDQTVGEVEAWIKTVQAGWNRDSLFLVITDTAKDGEVIGEGPLGYVNWEKKECESGVMLDHQRAGQGVATQVLNTSMDFAFHQLGLDTVKYGTMQDNKGMVKVLSEKLRVKGRPEGRTRKDGLKEFNFVFTKDEWPAASS